MNWNLKIKLVIKWILKKIKNNKILVINLNLKSLITVKWKQNKINNKAVVIN